MNLLDSLLDAIVRLQGDALVMHAGEKPYVVTTSPGMQAFRGPRAWGQVELSSRVLTHELVLSMAGQILPLDQRQALDEVGAIEHEVPGPQGSPDRFTVVAARGGDDVWLELRRHIVSGSKAEPPPADSSAEPRDIFEEHATVAQEQRGAPDAPVDDESPDAEAAGTLEFVEDDLQAVPTDDDVDAMLAATAAALLSPDSAEVVLLPDVDELEVEPADAIASTGHDEDAGWRYPVNEMTPHVDSPYQTAPDSADHGPAERDRAGRSVGDELHHPAAGEPAAPDTLFQKLLRTAGSRGASTVYIVAGMRPMARVKGDFGVLEGLPAFSADQVDQVLESMPPLDGDRGRDPDASEWLSDVPEVGRVRCVKFRDHRGPGAILRLVPASAVSADQLRLPDQVRDLCATDGLVLVSGAPASGKSTLLNGIVDLINRTRSDHVITIESRIQFVHPHDRSFISQREPGRDAAAVAAAVRDALREDPDVLAIDPVESAEVASVALEAVRAGRLVIASVTAATPSAAVSTLMDLFPHDERPRVLETLAADLRAVLSQILVRNATGGRTAAREVLLNTPAVAALIREGRLADAGAAGEVGEGHVTLDTTLASLVQDGAVHAAEGYRKASDRAAFVRLLQREGIDTSFAEKLA